MAKPIEIKERICRKISQVLIDLVKEKKLAVTINLFTTGTFIPDNTRSQLIGVLADELLTEKEILDAVGTRDLQRIIFDALWLSRNKPNMQDRAAFAAKLILAQRTVQKS